MWRLLLLVILGAVLGDSLPHSPCPDVYGYEMSDFGDVKGLIAIMAPPRYSEVQVVVVLSSPVSVNDRQVGELSLKGGRPAAEEATKQVLLGRRHVLQFYITFPAGKPVPTLLKITVNGKEFCSARETPPDSRAVITLHTFLSTGVSAPPTRDFGIVGSSSLGGFQDFGHQEVATYPVKVKDDYYLSTMIIKLLHILVDIEKQRLCVERQILSLGKDKHLSDRIHFDMDRRQPIGSDRGQLIDANCGQMISLVQGQPNVVHRK